MFRLNFHVIKVVSVVLLYLSGDGFLLADKEENAQYNPDLDYAQVRFVRAVFRGDSWTFSVTVRHRDEGWDHYADRWQVVDPGTGTVLAERILAHPHDTEQPFTRSLNGIHIPPDVSKVIVRASCTVHDFGGVEIVVNLEQANSTGTYEVYR